MRRVYECGAGFDKTWISVEWDNAGILLARLKTFAAAAFGMHTASYPECRLVRRAAPVPLVEIGGQSLAVVIMLLTWGRLLACWPIWRHGLPLVCPRFRPADIQKAGSEIVAELL